MTSVNVGVLPGPDEIWFSQDFGKEFAAALAKLQGELGRVVRNAMNTVGKETRGGDGPLIKKPYADLESVYDTIQEKMAENGFANSQFPTTPAQGYVAVTTMILHASGQWMMSTLRMPSGPTPQTQGSAITYARRYSLMAALGLAPTDDDDGALVSQSIGNQRSTAPRAAKERTTRQRPTDPAPDPEAAAPKPLEPGTPEYTEFWGALGWESKDEHDEMLRQVRSDVTALGTEARNRVSGWLAGRKPPYTADMLGLYSTRVLAELHQQNLEQSQETQSAMADIQHDDETRNEQL